MAMLGQVTIGVSLIASGTAAPGDQHVFYGIVIAFVFAPKHGLLAARRRASAPAGAE